MREIAFKILYTLEFSEEIPVENELKEDIRELLNEYHKGIELRNTNIRFALDIINGVFKNREKFDSYIKEFSDNWDFERISQVELIILRIALYEFLDMEKIPAVVTINEAVELSKSYGDEGSYRFVNGMLNSFKVSQGISKF